MPSRRAVVARALFPVVVLALLVPGIGPAGAAGPQRFGWAALRTRVTPAKVDHLIAPAAASLCAQLIGPLVVELVADVPIPPEVLTLLQPILSLCKPAAAPPAAPKPAKPAPTVPPPSTSASTTSVPSATSLPTPPSLPSVLLPPTPPVETALPPTPPPATEPPPAFSAAPTAPAAISPVPAAAHGFQYPAVLLLPLALLALVGYLGPAFVRPVSTRR